MNYYCFPDRDPYRKVKVVTAIHAIPNEYSAEKQKRWETATCSVDFKWDTVIESMNSKPLELWSRKFLSETNLSEPISSSDKFKGDFVRSLLKNFVEGYKRSILFESYPSLHWYLVESQTIFGIDNKDLSNISLNNHFNPNGHYQYCETELPFKGRCWGRDGLHDKNTFGFGQESFFKNCDPKVIPDNPEHWATKWCMGMKNIDQFTLSNFNSNPQHYNEELHNTIERNSFIDYGPMICASESDTRTCNKKEECERITDMTVSTLFFPRPLATLTLSKFISLSAPSVARTPDFNDDDGPLLQQRANSDRQLPTRKSSSSAIISHPNFNLVSASTASMPVKKRPNRMYSTSPTAIYRDSERISRSNSAPQPKSESCTGCGCEDSLGPCASTTRSEP